jgi:hypothetical protein
MTLQTTINEQIPFTPVKPIQVLAPIEALQRKIQEGLRGQGLDTKVSVTPLWDTDGKQMIGLSGEISTNEYKRFSQLGKSLLTSEERQLITMIRSIDGDRVTIYWCE